MIDQNSNDTTLPKWHQNNNLRFLAFNALFALIFFGPLRDLIRTSLSSEYDSYIVFIPFISAYLMYLDKQKIFLKRESSSALGLIAVAVGIFLLFIGRNQAEILEQRDYLAVMMFSAVTIWIGGFVFCYGKGPVRAAIFPLVFLFFMVPIPGAALEEIILFLQKGSTEVTSIFFRLTGIPAVRDGFVFNLPGIDIEVAKQCSGIRSSLSLVITGALAAYLFLRTGWARILLMLTIVPIAIIKNGIRIYTLSVLGVYWDKRILDSDLHSRGGIVFFILALVLASGVIALLRNMEKGHLFRNKKSGA